MSEPLRPAKSTPTRQKQGRRPSLAERVRAHCEASPPSRFSPDSMVTMARVIEQIAQDRDPLELALFMDWATGRLLGRISQKPGMPNEGELFPLGLQGIEELSRARHGRAFSTLTDARKRALLESIEDGEATGGVWSQVPPRYWYRRFYTKLLHGMFAERKEWVQIGLLRTADLGEQSNNVSSTALPDKTRNNPR